MNALLPASIATVVVLTGGCVTQHVTGSVEEHARVEGKRYADEVRAQSPFETVEISWSEAEDLMESRNLEYRSAEIGYLQAMEHTPIVEELTDQVKDMVDLSLGDLLKPDNLLKSLETPVTQLPQQLRSVSKLKDLSHQIEQNTWEKTCESFDAEVRMRKEKVKLHCLLKTGELIDGEIAQLGEAKPLPEDADPKLVAARQSWQNSLRQARSVWLTEVRDFFNAEYHDVHFKKDGSGLPTYRKMERPDLTDWQRWCKLTRSQELVSALQKAHDQQKPAVPGTKLVTDKLAEMIHIDLGSEPDVRLKTESVREEVRTLIRSWREMKQAQVQAAKLEATADQSLVTLDQVQTRQNLFKLRQQEIQSASVVWMLDEECWN
ncbi:hypothetical protein [Haloferula rosea]|uniref:Uncharacterized protein n=1 Tax=Haloferula rosea TaxID=490093 RepID=A0A934VFR8_9BACT|nr:hypothetical protein [Haloferula rosea]MBK1826865.1 hypothetical protein [Haloferula rosea]